MSRRNPPVERDCTLRRAAGGTGYFDAEAQICYDFDLNMTVGFRVVLAPILEADVLGMQEHGDSE